MVALILALGVVASWVRARDGEARGDMPLD